MIFDINGPDLINETEAKIMIKLSDGNLNLGDDQNNIVVMYAYKIKIKKIQKFEDL